MSSSTYNRRLVLWLAMYVASIWASNTLLRMPLHGAMLRAAIALLPMGAAFGMLVTVLQKVRSLDEFQRSVQLEALAIAVGATAILTLSYGFLQSSADAPSLSYIWVWPILATFWVAGSLIARQRYR